MPSSTSAVNPIKTEKPSVYLFHENTAFLNKVPQGQVKLWNARQSKARRDARLLRSFHLLTQLHESKRFGSTVNKTPIRK